MSTSKLGRPPIGPRYEFARPREIAELTKEVASYLGYSEADTTRLALDIGLSRLRARAARSLRRTAGNE
jgi:hypothetical protein